MPSLCCYEQAFSPVAVNRGCSLAAGRRLLLVAASLVAEHGHYGSWASAAVAPRLESTGSIVAVHGLSCSEKIF